MTYTVPICIKHTVQVGYIMWNRAHMDAVESVSSSTTVMNVQRARIYYNIDVFMYSCLSEIIKLNACL